MEDRWKNPSGHVGTRNCMRLRSQSTDMLCSRPSSSPELSNTVFFHSSNVNSHIMTDAIFVMQSILMCRSLYINYINIILLYICIYSHILSWNIIEKTNSGPGGTRTCVASLSVFHQALGLMHPFLG